MVLFQAISFKKMQKKDITILNIILKFLEILWDFVLLLLGKFQYFCFCNKT